MIVIGHEPAQVQLFLLRLEEIAPIVSTTGLPSAPDPENETNEFASEYVKIYESVYKGVMYGKKISYETLGRYFQFSSIFRLCSDNTQKSVLKWIHYYMQFSLITYEAKRGII